MLLLAETNSLRQSSGSNAYCLWCFMLFHASAPGFQTPYTIYNPTQMICSTLDSFLNTFRFSYASGFWYHYYFKCDQLLSSSWLFYMTSAQLFFYLLSPTLPTLIDLIFHLISLYLSSHMTLSYLTHHFTIIISHSLSFL